MANKILFKSLIGKLIPAADALNEERAPAYALSPKHQLAQHEPCNHGGVLVLRACGK